MSPRPRAGVPGVEIGRVFASNKGCFFPHNLLIIKIGHIWVIMRLRITSYSGHFVVLGEYAELGALLIFAVDV